MGQLQQQMKAKLEQLGVPFKQVECYGSQIVVTSHCRETADRWAALLSRFSRVKGVIETYDDAVINRNTVLLPSKVKVFRTFAVIQ